MKQYLQSIPLEAWVVIIGVVFILAAICGLFLVTRVIESLKTLKALVVPAEPQQIAQPITVTQHKEFASKQELADTESKLIEKIGAVETDVSELKTSIQANGETRRISIEGKVKLVDDRVTGVALSVSALEAHSQSQAAELSIIKSDIKQLLLRKAS